MGLSLVACTASSPSSSHVIPGETPTSSAIGMPAGWQRFESPRFGYSVGIPLEWSIQEVAGTGGIHPGEAGTDTFTGDNRLLTVTAVPVPDGADLAAWRSPIVDHYEGPEPEGHGAVAEEDGTLAVDGHDARLRVYRTETAPYEQLVLHAEAIVGGNAYLITYLGLARQDEAYRNEFAMILQTIDLP